MRKNDWAPCWLFLFTSPHFPLLRGNPSPSPALSLTQVLLQSFPICNLCCQIESPSLLCWTAEIATKLAFLPRSFPSTVHSPQKQAGRFFKCIREHGNPLLDNLWWLPCTTTQNLLEDHERGSPACLSIPMWWHSLGDHRPRRTGFPGVLWLYQAPSWPRLCPCQKYSSPNSSKAGSSWIPISA